MDKKYSLRVMHFVVLLLASVNVCLALLPTITCGVQTLSNLVETKTVHHSKVIFERIEIVDLGTTVSEVTFDDPVYLEYEYPTDIYVKYIEEEIKVPEKTYTDKELDLLSRLAHAEAESEGLDGMRRVVDVVLNRVDDNRFPNTIEDVIFQPGQFVTSENLSKTIKTKSSGKATQLELEALKADRLENESLYFARVPITQKGLHQVGNHYFSK